MPKVSIIVPVYNVEKYLKQCLDSVLAQTLQDIEIICVNDGSTDSCTNILDEYAEQDARVIVIHKANSGYGDSMNVGFERASGTYIGIVESDDVIKPNMFEVLYNKAEEYALDFVKSNAIFWWEKIGMERAGYNPALEKDYDRVLTPSDREVMYRFMMYTWTGIYRRSFLEKYQIRHNTTPGASYQDQGFWIQTLSFAERVMWLSDAFYYYRQDNPLSSVKSKGKMYAMMNEYDYLNDVLKGRIGKIEEDMLLYYRMYRQNRNFYRIDDTLKRDFCDTLIEEYRRYGKYLENYEALRKWYMDVCENPDTFCNTIIEKKRKILEKIEKAEEIVIYGAGVRARKIMLRLYNVDAFHKVKHVVVTTLEQPCNLEQIEVEELTAFNDYNEQTLFIISVNEQTDIYAEMVSNLKKKGVSNYIGSTDIIDLIYSVYVR